jgi:hypothetical protein
VTIFLAVPIERRETAAAGRMIVVWLPVWIVLAAAIRLVTVLRSHTR